MKPATTLDQQLTLLTERGLLIPDPSACRRFLYDTGYYRVSGYARQFQRAPRDGENAFDGLVSLADLQRIIDLDTELSLALTRCLGVVERVVRARFAYELAAAHGSGAFYLDAAAYVPQMPDLPRFLDRVEDELRRSKSRTVAHYVRGNELSEVPVWVAFEQLSFGTISRILEYFADPSPRERVAATFSEQRGIFASTIHSLAVLRNRCAHHGQLWHRRLAIQTPTVRKERKPSTPSFDPQGIYPAFLAIRRLLRQVPSCVDGIDDVEHRITSTDEVFTQGLLNPNPRW